MTAGKARQFSFRWDIDHRACITDGLPNILAVCREFAVRNTFFVNMGRSTNLREWLLKGGIRGTKAKLGDMEAIHLIKKIGWPRFALETVLARPVGRSMPRQLEAVLAAGHELGLHGGSDHVIWSRRFGELPEEVLQADVSATLEEFSRSFGRPSGFTSPGFRSDERVTRIVERLGFEYDGDAIGGAPHRPVLGGRPVAHWRIPVTICGPRTIPFLEWHGARGTPQAAVLEDFDRLLDGGDEVVMYGHPCYEGVQVELLKSVFRRVLDRGFSFVTHADWSARLRLGACA
jgi:peptidoglycan/xylan/chitin deacetylase (PgdA/CDA1 family)